MSETHPEEYMADDPNLTTQPDGAGNGMTGLEVTSPNQDNARETTTGRNATAETTNTVVEDRVPDVEMTDSRGGSGGTATGTGTGFTFGAALASLVPAGWTASRVDTESRKRKERSPSPVATTNGENQSTDATGAHKRLRGIISAAGPGVPVEEVNNGVIDGRDSTTRPSGSGSEAPEHTSGDHPMPGALLLTGAGASTSATLQSTTNGSAIASGTSNTSAIVPSTGLFGSSVAGSTSENREPPKGDGTSATTTTPPGSPPRPNPSAELLHPSGEAPPIPEKGNTPLPNPPPPIDRPAQPTNVNGPSAEALTEGSTSRPAIPLAPATTASSGSGSATPNNPDPWVFLAKQFDGVRTEIQSMGTHMRAMNSNIGRLDNAMGIMADNHTELMSMLRTSLGRPINPFAPAGHAPPPPGPPPPGPPPTAPVPALSAGGPGPATPGIQPPAPIAPRTTGQRTLAPHPPNTTTSSRTSGASSSHAPTSRSKASSDDAMEIDDGDAADSEGEIPQALPVVVKLSKPKLKGMPKPRDPVRKALLDDIAIMARKYMGRDSCPDDDEEDDDVLFFDDSMVPSSDEVAAFNGRAGQCCTIDDFRPDLNGTPRSTWNQSVAQVFAKEYVKAATAKSKDVTEVGRAFGVHMKTLINSYKTFQASQDVNNAKRRKRRRYMRKSYAHQRRMMIAASHDGLKRHLWVLQALGAQGMSSDESEHEGTEIRYRRTTLAWRNPTLETFLHVFDVFHDASRFTEDANKSSKSGSHVHRRLPAKKVSERAAVPGLPEAAYNPTWLQNLSEFFRNRLNISNVQYQFAHSPKVMQEMMLLLRPPPPAQETVAPVD